MIGKKCGVSAKQQQVPPPEEKVPGAARAVFQDYPMVGAPAAAKAAAVSKEAREAKGEEPAVEAQSCVIMCNRDVDSSVVDLAVAQKKGSCSIFPPLGRLER